MNDMQTAGVYIAVNILLLIYLALRVVRNRRRGKIRLGDGGDEGMERAIRVHGNASENIPIAMIGLVAMVSLQAGALMIHICGSVFTAGRLIHAFGLSTGALAGRQLGMLLTWLSMLAIAGIILWKAFSPVV